MSEIVKFATVRKGDKSVGIDQVRTVSAQGFKNVMGGRASLGAKDQHTVIVQLTDEQIERINKGESIPVEEFGVFSSAKAAAVAAENNVLKTENELKEQRIAELEASLEELRKQAAEKQAGDKPKNGTKTPE